MPLSFKHETCSGCRVCLLICALHNFRETNPFKALLRVHGKFPAPGKYRVDLCSQCGKCAAACPVDAICEENGTYAVQKEICVGCGACIDACPQKLVRFFDNMAYKCSGCGECADLCPRDAIKNNAKEEPE